MANPVMPRGMRPVTEGYSMSAPGGVARTEVAGGLARYGLAWDRGVQPFRVTMILDDTQFSVWVAFFLHVIKKGSIAFEMPLDSGFGAAPHLCNILPDSYNANRTAGGNYSVSFVVEAESAAYQMTSADALTLIAFYNEYGRDSAAMLSRLNQFANLDTMVLGT